VEFSKNSHITMVFYLSDFSVMFPTG